MRRTTYSKVDLSKWVLVQKCKAAPSGELTVRFLARVVARGFMLIEGVDVLETCGPVVQLTSIRVFLSITDVQNMHLHLLDMKTAFLNRELEETLYVKQPAGCTPQGKEQLVCRLKKALYGLRQAPRQLYANIYCFLVENMDIKSDDADDFMYTGIRLESMVIIDLYVDDLLIASQSMKIIDHVKAELPTRSCMKDVIEARMILCFEIHRDCAK